MSAVAKIERLALVPAVFDTVGTPTAVVDELERAKATGYEFVTRIDAVKSYNGGWLKVVSPTQSELQLADEIRDHALSTTDSQCLAIASQRGRRLVTDDAHVGTIGDQRGVDVWDLTLFLKAAIRVDAIESVDELTEILEALRRNDGYRFSATDEESLFEEF
ncbi:hypothetical protein [Haloterrigena alkaliphila]|uniref:PIN domain-containing protein n=1 Tax=Haloterrigena alkaliphila TaxID=2816475 RepID=A0A8A2V9S0_9EURY|nr:hypothetical protein [Haloterrigena alkaliphila]QSW98221.1 hypothetical protein J0X25_12500 [Haloterrigena alkaliphila]